jgi:hypothetical protein
VESFFKTLKTEEVEWNEYESLSEAQAQIGAYMEREYNRTRLHSSLGYRPPEEYERLGEEAADAAEFSQGMSRSIDPMTKDKAGYGPRAAPRTHRLDESAAGYCLAGWSPLEPASASPAALIMLLFGWIRYAFSVNGNTSLLSWPRLRSPLHVVPVNVCDQNNIRFRPRRIVAGTPWVYVPNFPVDLKHHTPMVNGSNAHLSLASRDNIGGRPGQARD